MDTLSVELKRIQEAETPINAEHDIFIRYKLHKCNAYTIYSHHQATGRHIASRLGEEFNLCSFPSRYHETIEVSNNPLVELEKTIRDSGSTHRASPPHVLLDLVLIVLTEGYLDSSSCLTEFRFAIKYDKPVYKPTLSKFSQKL